MIFFDKNDVKKIAFLCQKGGASFRQERRHAKMTWTMTWTLICLERILPPLAMPPLAILSAASCHACLQGQDLPIQIAMGANAIWFLDQICKDHLCFL